MAILSVTMKCKHCDARYHLSVFEHTLSRSESVFYDLLGHIFILLLILPLLLLFMWLTDYLPWYLALLSIFIAWSLIAMLISIQINHKDPINKTIQRVQAKTNLKESDDSASDR